MFVETISNDVGQHCHRTKEQQTHGYRCRRVTHPGWCHRVHRPREPTGAANFNQSFGSSTKDEGTGRKAPQTPASMLRSDFSAYIGIIQHNDYYVE